MAKKIKLDNKVKWESQAMGCYTEKIGVVKFIIPAGTRVDDTMRGLLKKDYKLMFDGSGSRTTESYLVVVKGGKTDKATPKLYWPPASKLVRA